MPQTGDPIVNLTVFAAFVLVSLAAVLRVARRNRTAAAFYTAGGGFGGTENGIALTGDYLSAAAFLGVVGTVAVYGYDGVLFAIGSTTGWVLTLLFIAEPMRNTGRFTLGDVLSYRLRARPVRAAAATSTLLVSMLYLVANIAGAGELIALLAGVPNSDRAGQSLLIAGVGVIMLIYVLVGGMAGTTWVQIMKAALLFVTGAVLAAWVMGRWFFNLSELLGATVAANPDVGERLLGPGVEYGQTPLSTIDFLSLGVAGLLGPASLPHLITRFFTVPDGKQARRSVVWAIWMIGLFFLCAIVLGLGASAILTREGIVGAPGGSNSAAPLLAYEMGGPIVLGVVAAIAFATILAVVAGLTITASACFAHDVYANILRRGVTQPRSEVRVARMTALVVGLLATGGGIVANGQNIAVLVGVIFAVAASANLPALLYSLYWKRFTTAGALASIYGGGGLALLLIAFSPVVSGTPTSLLPGIDVAFFPLANPGMVSVPVSFALGAIATWVTKPAGDAERRHAEMTVRAITGAKRVEHTPRPTPEPSRPVSMFR
jgi:cation/acetate symporter